MSLKNTVCRKTDLLYFFCFPILTTSKKKPFSHALCSFIFPNALPHTIIGISAYKGIAYYFVCGNSRRIP